MDRIGILLVSYGARETAMADRFSRSEEYKVDLYIVDRQRNPFNAEIALDHKVIPDLDVQAIKRYAAKHRGDLDFAVVGPEKPIIDGVRDLLEGELGIPTICPTRSYALEGSKVRQRMLLQEALPEVNVRFKVFNPEDLKDESSLKSSLYEWLDELGGEAVVKPDAPAAGKGVGVWGDHFTTREGLYNHFKENLAYGPVIVEEKVIGEESSFQAFCDGAHLTPLPDTRDYKRAFEGDLGPNTGGMGSYKDVGEVLPFLSREDREREMRVAEELFQALKGRGSNPNLMGVPFYIAFIHTRGGVKVLEINSRPGDPEIINILPVMRDDLVDVCLKILDGDLRRVDLERKATVVVYKVPPSYGGFLETYPERVDKNQLDRPVDLTEARAMADRDPSRLRIYPASMELRDGQIYPLRSRAVCSVGIDDSIQEARRRALEALERIKGGALWYRGDVASQDHINRSIAHMRSLREP
ncbi:MAG: hypothetical protein QW569_06755 [Candidatus Bathyarchaeia archaeon]|nr:hypothetical protein [Candidatus Bathyarchaeota archaeon]